ncbi:MAG: hypothetical protein J5J00_08520 [Deltaproteobacteria bacterium]|nr:hypothetical protein [Deltaproteobacteria bacterium]
MNPVRQPAGVFSAPLMNYFVGLNHQLNLVNALPKEGEDIYGASGPDAAAPLIILNSTRLKMIDTASINLCQLRKLIEGDLTLEQCGSKAIETGREWNRGSGFWNSIHTGNLAVPLFATLKALGVENLEMISPAQGVSDRILEKLYLTEGPLCTTIAFKWRHPNDKEPKEREVTVCSRISLAEAFSPGISLVPKRIRAYFEKAAVLDGAQDHFLQSHHVKARLEGGGIAVVSKRYEQPDRNFPQYREIPETPYTSALRECVERQPYGHRDGYGWRIRLLRASLTN